VFDFSRKNVAYSKTILAFGVMFLIMTLIKSEISDTNSTDSNETDHETSGDDSFDEQTKQILKEMGINESETIDRETFKKLFERVIFRDEEVNQEEKQVFLQLIDRVAKDVPDTFPTADISKYLDMNRLSDILTELMGSPSDAGVDLDGFKNDMEEHTDEDDLDQQEHEPHGQDQHEHEHHDHEGHDHLEGEL